MIREFIDIDNRSDHNRFQSWRAKNQGGIFLGLVTRASANLHGARCQHHGSGPPYFSAKAGGGSLTLKRKVCGPESELLAWAKNNGVTVKRCLHCVRDGFIRPAPLETGTEVFAGPGHWIIKAKPDRNDLTTLLKGGIHRWYTKRLPKAWRTGDTLFIWAGAPTLRVIGRARLIKPNDGYDHGAHHFRVKNITSRVEGPTIQDLRKDPLFRNASFLKSGPAGTAFSLTTEQGSRMLQLLVLSEPSASGSSGLPNAKAAVAGFGTAEDNRKIERAAIAAAREHYKASGWRVRSVEADRVGFDLHCQRGRQVRHVEVKGISGDGSGFILTQGEYRKAASDGNFELCLVERTLSNPEITVFGGDQMFEEFQFLPLAYKAMRQS